MKTVVAHSIDIKSVLQQYWKFETKKITFTLLLVSILHVLKV